MVNCYLPCYLQLLGKSTEDITCELESPKEPMEGFSEGLAAGTGRAHEVCYRKAVMEPEAKPWKRHPLDMSGSWGHVLSQEQAPPKKFKNPLNLKKNMA
ncbi:MAG: hypothetical protein IKQ13_07965 [Treponema sp.]|nr:hypothetical protein [Treponema sp.]